MKTYKVWVKDISYNYALIEAEDEDAAFDIAKEMDGSDFIQSNQTEWDIYSVEEQTKETT